MPLSDSMSNGDAYQAPDRRQNARHAPNSLSYVHLEESNGGILINVSEGGLAVHAAMAVMEDDLPRIRLQIPRSTKWLETSARVVWAQDSRRMVGIEFLDLQEEARKHIREWLAHESGEYASPAAEAFPHEHPVRSSASNVEEIPLKPVRHLPQTRSQAANSADFDMAALLTSREAARVAVTRAMKVPAEPVQPVAPISVEREIASEASPAPKAKSSQSRNSYIVILAVLALVSVAAGWETGKGSLLRALFLPSSAASPGAKLGTEAGATGAFAANFEVIDANNQAWLVPFMGPTSAPSGPALPALPSKAAAILNQPAPRNSNSFQVGALTAPQSSANSKSAQVSAAAPVLPTPSGGAPLPSSIAEPGPNFSLVPPTSQPQPVQVRSNLVEPKLLHSVQPIYPTAALTQRVEGSVTIHAHILENGNVSEVKAVSGSGLLAPAAITAVRQWKYVPEVLDGRAVASDIVVTIQFSLPR